MHYSDSKSLKQIQLSSISESNDAAKTVKETADKESDEKEKQDKEKAFQEG